MPRVAALTITGSGPCEIQASETGQAAGYAVATPMDQTFTVAPAALQTNTITFGAAPTGVTFGEAPGTHSVHATATSGTITYTSLTPSVCTVNATSGALTITGSGSCEIQASETGQAASYAVATPLDQTFTVAPATKVATTITQFSFPGTVAYGNESDEVFSAVITNSGSKLPTGTVTFMSGRPSCAPRRSWSRLDRTAWWQPASLPTPSFLPVRTP